MKQSWNRNDWIFLAVLAGCAVLYCWRIHIGMSLVDESLCVSIALRFANGERMIVDEWNLAQLSSFSLIPAVKLYVQLNHGTEGIYLFFRYLYTALQLLAGTAGYLLNRRRGWIAIVMSAVYMLFVPLGIFSPTYNSMPLWNLYLVGMILISPYHEKKSAQILIGILYAFALIGQPFLLLIYAVYLLTVIYCSAKKKDFSVFTWKYLGWITIGALCVGAVFLIYLFSSVRLSDMMKALGPLLQDETHTRKSCFDIFINPFVIYGLRLNLYRFSFLICAALACWAKRRKDAKWLRISYELLLLSCFLELAELGFLRIKGYGEDVIGMNAIMLVLPKLGLYCWVFGEDRSERMLAVVWVMSFLFGFCNHLASNQNIFTIATAMTIAGVVSIPVIYNYSTSLLDQNRRKLCLLMGALLVFQISAEINVMLRHVFHEDDVDALTVEIERGPAKGLKTSSDVVTAYNTMLADLDQTYLDAGRQGTRVLLLDNHPLEYVYLNAPVGAYSVWNELKDALNTPRFQIYYQLDESRIPGYIYIDSDTVEKHGEQSYISYAQQHGYQSQKLKSGAMILVK